jgi:hypothetical protein
MVATGHGDFIENVVAPTRKPVQQPAVAAGTGMCIVNKNILKHIHITNPHHFTAIKIRLVELLLFSALKTPRM